MRDNPANTPDSHPTGPHPPNRKLALWTVLLLPLILVLIAAAMHFRTLTTTLELLIPAKRQWNSCTAKMREWTLHGRYDYSEQGIPSSSSHSPGLSHTLAVRGTPTLAPTVPANPVLPTPFPQPFDTTLSTGFSTNSCYNFFINMTQSDPFRSCRPFSLLLTKSQAFQQAQKDINAMNTDVWGTCNTDIVQNQCDANMAWFAATLQSSCRTDLAAQNAMATDTLIALQAYDLMRNAGCQVDTATNAYCYVEAVADPDPSSYWFYLLPLGRPLVLITNGVCSVCTQTLMAMYADALSSSNSTSLAALAQVYTDAANSVNNACGPSYVKATTIASSSGMAKNKILRLWTLFALLFFTGSLLVP
ncbi:hypothetical protein F5I97DRAFT_1807133 [Phlebopus sp. FC_14]|nr:hypothetical protein F5I97DRAFT_1807133 [Phlebopus sp. FC_14]